MASNNTVEGRYVETTERNEVQETSINIHFAIFVDGGKGSKGAVQKLRNSFIFTEDSATDRYIYICESLSSKENLYSTQEEQGHFEINIEDDLPQAISDSVCRLIKSIDNKLHGFYSYANNARLYFNVFGADTGCLPAIVLINIIEPETVDATLNNDLDIAILNNSTCETINYFRACGSSVILDSYTFLDIEKDNKEKKDTTSRDATEIPVTEYQISDANDSVTMLTGQVVYNERAHVFDFLDNASKLKEQIKTTAYCAKMQIRQKYLPYIKNGVSSCRKKVSDANFSIFTFCSAKENESVWASFKQISGKFASIKEKYINESLVQNNCNKEKLAIQTSKNLDVQFFHRNNNNIVIDAGKIVVKKTNETNDNRLSEHFTLSELCRTDTGLKNTPDAGSTVKLKQLCTALLEPIRKKCGHPIIINSGYRSNDVNTKVKGSSTSQHLYG